MVLAGGAVLAGVGAAARVTCSSLLDGEDLEIV